MTGSVVFAGSPTVRAASIILLAVLLFSAFTFHSVATNLWELASALLRDVQSGRRDADDHRPDLTT
jgi:hypothetical protein